MPTFDRPVIHRESPKPQTWLLFGPDSVLSADDGASLLDLPTIVLGPRTKDLTGKKFGRLTALHPVEKRRGKLVWLCQCSCGHFTKVKGSFLSNSNTKSCGCLQKEKVSQRQFKDLHGQRFGRLIVLSQNGKTKAGRIRWLCQCSCGKQTTITSGDLLTRHTKSCSCLRKEKACLRIGPKHPNWNPKLASEDRIKHRFGIYQIRSQVFLRDNYTCALCGQHGGVINAHHMEPWSKNPALRFDRDNMVTLCSSCHKKFHRSFPAKTANSYNFIEWIKARKVSLSCQSSSPGRSR